MSAVVTGRHLTLEPFPFDLGEFRRVRPEGTFEDYLEAGGLPAPLLIDRGAPLRQQSFSDIIERDIRELAGARSAVAMKRVVQKVFETAGTELRFLRLAGAAGVAVDTVAAIWRRARPPIR